MPREVVTMTYIHHDLGKNIEYARGTKYKYIYNPYRGKHKTFGDYK